MAHGSASGRGGGLSFEWITLESQSGVRLIPIPSPRPVHTHIGVVFGLAGDRVAVAKQELFTGVMVEASVCAAAKPSRPCENTSPPSSNRAPKLYFSRKPP